ncbi:hypothetical protein ACQ661_00545 [Pseudidiomarina sp. WS423]|uniref:hypothetical protein n=1 Tax=Pseudidiomarina sp. WS423 TaxID=3425124 RepID=UPI003D6E417E
MVAIRLLSLALIVSLLWFAPHAQVQTADGYQLESQAIASHVNSTSVHQELLSLDEPDPALPIFIRPTLVPTGPVQITPVIVATYQKTYQTYTARAPPVVG